ncbi:aldose epimerase family protein [Winogradskyella sp. SYSU M77433]|uniref:aldose epimerase family protein n=1 Tax=Winogradskyella sp. SYSU M77433 TaxID=3042722 RepID=UPI00248154B5|nr:aldose epimerase family protein [Winogradskyella sp. SYSU M77433]MDH7911707.1 aldose epimerase family protein [Winogradskyella sp. SYSU M77433]
MKNLKPVLYCFVFALVASLNIQCKESKKEESTEKPETMVQEKLAITKSEFGKTEDSTTIEQYTLKNANGVEMDVITYGGRITSLKVPNKDGKLENVVLGFDNIEDYQKDNPFFGALIGRYGNRIAKGKFTLNGEEFTLATNDGSNHLHGGVNGFDRVVWTATPVEGTEDSTLKLTYTSKDGEEGYPGNLEVTVTYTLTKDNAVEVTYEATTDKATVVNLTQHAYFNLTGDFSKDILNHDVVINADAFLPVDETLIPTGEIRKVEGTPFNFNSSKKIGEEINADNEQLKRGKGYDHCWVLNGEKGDMRFVASAYDETSGRFMEIFTEEPAIQFYTGNFLDGTLPMVNGGTYAHRTGFCLETQHYPDSPNQDNFPSTVLNPGNTYKTKTTFKFSTK